MITDAARQNMIGLTKGVMGFDLELISEPLRTQVIESIYYYFDISAKRGNDFASAISYAFDKVINIGRGYNLIVTADPVELPKPDESSQ